MKHLVVILPLITLSGRICADKIETAEYVDSSQRAIRFIVDGKELEVTAPKGKLWQNLVVCKDKKSAYFMLWSGTRKDGGRVEDLHKFSVEPDQGAPNPSMIPLKTNLKEAVVSMIYDANTDGSRLLIELSWFDEEPDFVTFPRCYPYFLDTSDGKLTPVEIRPVEP